MIGDLEDSTAGTDPSQLQIKQTEGSKMTEATRVSLWRRETKSCQFLAMLTPSLLLTPRYSAIGLRSDGGDCITRGGTLFMFRNDFMWGVFQGAHCENSN